jgi:hypothetical protein
MPGKNLHVKSLFEHYLIKIFYQVKNYGQIKYSTTQIGV